MLKVAYHPIYRHQLVENHRFPMIKYELIPEQLIREGVCNDDNFFTPTAIQDSDILTTHSNEYLNKLNSLSLSKKEARPIGFPLSNELINREKIIMQGTVDSALAAIKNGVSMNVAGGTHHAFKGKGEAFCLLNDQAIAANFLLKKNLVKKILIVDLDVHQGNGTASIFENNKDVFTLSFHGKNNYPFRKETSDLDIEFDDGTNDSAYLNKLKYVLPSVIDDVEPDFVFYLSGVDVIENDKLGKLALSIDGCKKRDQFVFEKCKENKLPVQVSMGGGYSSILSEIINSHVNTFKLAQDIFF